MKAAYKKLLREYIKTELDELLKADAAKIAKLKLALKKNYKNNPDLLKRLTDFIIVNSVSDPYMTYNKMVDELMFFYKDELKQTDKIKV